MGGLPSFTCRTCGMTSYHPKDAEHGYCGNCRSFTGDGTVRSMTDAEFVEELAERLNLWLQADASRANAALLTRLAHAGYANVGHLLGQICFPRGIDLSQPPRAESLEAVKFLAPVVEEGRIMKFEAVTGAELQQRQQEMAQKAAQSAATGPNGKQE